MLRSRAGLRAGLPRWLLAAGLIACSSSTGTPPDPDALPAPQTPVAGWESRLFRYALDSPVPGIASRNVTVILPPGYGDAANAARRYPVLYLQDGQNCLDTDPFHRTGWGAHTTSTDLISRGAMAPILVVLVDNGGGTVRAAEYNPGQETEGATAEKFLDFLEKTVVRRIDANFRTLPEASQRAMGGSSFGGVISLHAGWTRPQVFGRVLAMSPAFRLYDFPAVVRAATAKKPLRIYLDSGTTGYGVEDGRAETEGLRDLLAARGWTPGQDLFHTVGVGDAHDEPAWRRRLPGALTFLFPP